MPAMRLYEKEEFFKAVKDLGLTETEHDFGTHRMWTDEKGSYYTVSILPDGEKYPDYYLDALIQKINITQRNRN